MIQQIVSSIMIKTKGAVSLSEVEIANLLRAEMIKAQKDQIEALTKNIQANTQLETNEGKTFKMLMSTPFEHANLVSRERWLNMKRSLMELLHKKVWKKIEGDAPIFDENIAKYSEWTEGSFEYRGMRNTSGQKHGIVRKMDTSSGGFIVVDQISESKSSTRLLNNERTYHC